jgi:hypothetical protein
MPKIKNIKAYRSAFFLDSSAFDEKYNNVVNIFEKKNGKNWKNYTI